MEPSSGRVVIDGIDTSTIGLFDLRSRLALVPQASSLKQQKNAKMARFGVGAGVPAAQCTAVHPAQAASACRAGSLLQLTAPAGIDPRHAAAALHPFLTQDPVIFSGTVRSNLDPFGNAGSDDAIWEALAQVRCVPSKYKLHYLSDTLFL